MAEKVVVEIEIKDGKAVASLDKVEKQVDNIGKSSKKASKGVKGFGDQVKLLGKTTGVLALLAAAFEILKEAFSNNQQVIDATQTAVTALGIAFNDLFRFIQSSIDPVVEFFKAIFDDPLGSLEALADAIKNNIEVRINAFIDTLGLLGQAVSKLFAGEFSEAANIAAEAGEKYVDVLTGVPNTVDKVTEAIEVGTKAIVDYTVATVKQADAIVQAEKSLVILENTQTRIREQADRDAERQRQIRDDETRSIQERIDANNELAKILDEQQKNELAAVDAQIAALGKRLALDAQNQEVRNEIFKLNTERLAIEAQQEGFRSEQLLNQNSLLRERKDIINELNLIGAEETEKLLQEAQRVYQEQKTLIEREITDEFEKNVLLLKADKEFSAARIRIAESESDKKKRISATEEKAKVDTAKAGLQAIQTLSGEGSKIGKTAAVVQATIDTIKGAQSAFANTIGGIGLKSIAAAAAVAVGIANVKKILAVQTPGGGGGGVAAPTVSAATALPPQFSTPENDANQLADTISGSINQQPVKAFVVADDVTSQQQMDRITINNATV